MNRAIVFAVLAVVAFSSPIPEVPENFEDIPAEYKSLIPPEVVEHLKSITAEDKVILKELAKNYKSYKNEDDFLNALKEKSPTLHEKAAKLHASIKTKIDTLVPEAKAFVKKVIAEARQIHQQYLAGEKPNLETLKATAQKYITEYKTLSDESKTSIGQQFPILTGLAKNEKIQAIASKYIN